MQGQGTVHCSHMALPFPGTHDIVTVVCNQQYQGFNKDQLTGTEIVEVWKKLVKSRGL